jgi:ribosome-binding protein aMBF1 (putative translation factor)
MGGGARSYIPFWDYTIMGCTVKRMSRSVHSDDYKGIIKRLKEARVESGLSQQEVADKLGKPQSYVSKIESGERRLDVAEIKKFASVYKKNVSFFLK